MGGLTLLLLEAQDPSISIRKLAATCTTWLRVLFDSDFSLISTLQYLFSHPPLTVGLAALKYRLCNSDYIGRTEEIYHVCQ